MSLTLPSPLFTLPVPFSKASPPSPIASNNDAVDKSIPYSKLPSSVNDSKLPSSVNDSNAPLLKKKETEKKIASVFTKNSEYLRDSWGIGGKVIGLIKSSISLIEKVISNFFTHCEKVAIVIKAFVLQLGIFTTIKLFLSSRNVWNKFPTLVESVKKKDWEAVFENVLSEIAAVGATVEATISLSGVALKFASLELPSWIKAIPGPLNLGLSCVFLIGAGKNLSHQASLQQEIKHLKNKLNPKDDLGQPVALPLETKEKLLKEFISKKIDLSKNEIKEVKDKFKDKEIKKLEIDKIRSKKEKALGGSITKASIAQFKILSHTLKDKWEDKKIENVIKVIDNVQTFSKRKLVTSIISIATILIFSLNALTYLFTLPVIFLPIAMVVGASLLLGNTIYEQFYIQKGLQEIEEGSLRTAVMA